MSSTIKKYQLNGRIYTFICRSRDTRHGFAHDSELFLGDGYLIGEATCRYLNRTWERYRYQSVMIEVVHQKISQLTADAVSEFKRQQGVSRITEKRRPALEAFINEARANNALWFELDQLLDMIK